MSSWGEVTLLSIWVPSRSSQALKRFTKVAQGELISHIPFYGFDNCKNVNAVGISLRSAGETEEATNKTALSELQACLHINVQTSSCVKVMLKNII